MPKVRWAISHSVTCWSSERAAYVISSLVAAATVCAAITVPLNNLTLIVLASRLQAATAADPTAVYELCDADGGKKGDCADDVVRTTSGSDVCATPSGAAPAVCHTDAYKYSI